MMKAPDLTGPDFEKKKVGGVGELSEIQANVENQQPAWSVKEISAFFLIISAAGEYYD